MKRKKEWILFLTWMRNGSAFCISWFLILWVLYNSFYGIPTVTTKHLTELIVLVITGVFLFCTFFTGLFLRNWSFTFRLTCFLIAISILECIAFYRLGLFVREGSVTEWAVFIGIILALYTACILIYRVYSRHRGELYTKGLKQYQQSRREEHGKQ